MTDNSLALLSPKILPYVKEILSDGKIGICAGNIHIIDIQTGCSTLEKQPCGDRFKLIIPFAGQSITWEVLFNSRMPEQPPDFRFDDKSFLAVPDVQELAENVPSLLDWRPDDNTALLRVVRELMGLYRKHQVVMLEEHSRLQFEYSSLLCQAGITDRDIEIQLNKKTRGGSVNFLICLPVDFSNIPPVLTQDNPGTDSAVLLVTFNSPEGTRITPQLYLSPRVEQALGGSLSLHIPAFPSGGCLMDFVPTVMDMLKSKVEQIVSGFEKRKDYLAAFLSNFGRSILEYDTEAFSSLSLLLEWNDFHFILHISLPVYFPQDKPTFTFQSVYHATYGKPYMVKCDNYPYSPRWSGDEMADRTKSFILDYIPVFQKNSIRSSQT